MLSSCVDDKQGILSRRASMCGKVNNVLCYFTKCDPLVRLKLVRSYCSDLYGSMLWDMSRILKSNPCEDGGLCCLHIHVIICNKCI